MRSPQQAENSIISEQKFLWELESFRCRRLPALLDTRKVFERNYQQQSAGGEWKWCHVEFWNYLCHNWVLWDSTLSHSQNYKNDILCHMTSLKIDPSFREKLLHLSLNSPDFNGTSIVLHRWLLFWTLEATTRPRLHSLAVLISCWEVAKSFQRVCSFDLCFNFQFVSQLSPNFKSINFNYGGSRSKWVSSGWVNAVNFTSKSFQNHPQTWTCRWTCRWTAVWG